MPTAATIPVRLSDDLLSRLDAYAKKIGVSRSAAIRLCLSYQLGIITTADPRELPALDGRRFRYTTHVAALGENKLSEKTEKCAMPHKKNLPVFARARGAGVRLV